MPGSNEVPAQVEYTNIMKIIITGASRGIGLATATLLDRPGNELYLIASSLDSFKNTFNNAHLFAADLSKTEDIGKVIADISNITDTIDVLVNNVGVYVPKKFSDMDESDIHQMLDTNLRSQMLLTHACLGMLGNSNNPSIVFVSSMAAKYSIVGESVYSASKSGLTGFANVLRKEKPANARVSVVHSWGVNTWGAPEDNTLLKPDDVAQAIDFIISRPADVLIESIDIGNVDNWRGGDAPWSPK